MVRKSTQSDNNNKVTICCKITKEEYKILTMYKLKEGTTTQKLLYKALKSAGLFKKSSDLVDFITNFQED